MLIQKIKQLASLYHGEIVNIRRHLHQHPELSFVEVETGKLIAKNLKILAFLLLMALLIMG